MGPTHVPVKHIRESSGNLDGKIGTPPETRAGIGGKRRKGIGISGASIVHPTKKRRSFGTPRRANSIETLSEVSGFTSEKQMEDQIVEFNPKKTQSANEPSEKTLKNSELSPKIRVCDISFFSQFLVQCLFNLPSYNNNKITHRIHAIQAKYSF